LPAAKAVGSGLPLLERIKEYRPAVNKGNMNVGGGRGPKVGKDKHYGWYRK